ncbi:hypothetical protein [Candidatus Phyllobacterium onerii]|uniref:hypothetical protein n=1 Tax=Candidatus Phyllobacterium onerii TaxID=3020828 RepID=UPI00232F1C19|nr:hypothetical protein [Phyllobacterium sp. IY22]
MKRSPLPEILTLLRLSVDDMDVSYHQSVRRDTLMMGPPHRVNMRADQEQITTLFFRQAQKIATDKGGRYFFGGDQAQLHDI